MSTVSDLNRQVWLLLLAKGGWWTAREVELELVLTHGSMLPRMHKMSGHGSLEKRSDKAARSASFAVTPTCTIPQGITVLEVQEALSDEGLAHRPYRGLPARNGHVTTHSPRGVIQ